MLIGHLGQDPKVITTQTGRTLTELSLATNESYKNSEGVWIKDTDWHRCIAWGKLAELLGNLCKKGQELAVRGKLAYNIYEDNDGNRRKIPQVVIADFSILSKKATNASADQPPSKPHKRFKRTAHTSGLPGSGYRPAAPPGNVCYPTCRCRGTKAVSQVGVCMR